MTDKPKTIIIKIANETYIQSLISDLATFVLALSLIGVGIYLESDAMQWVGAIVFFLTTMAKGSGKVKTLKPDEAIKYIEELIKETK